MRYSLRRTALAPCAGYDNTISPANPAKHENQEQTAVNRKSLIPFVLLTLLVTAPGLAGAQQEPPLALLIDGDLWTWSEADGAFRQLTFWGYNHQPVMSPDGARVAYESAAAVTVEALEREGFIGGGSLPGNIWVLDLATGDGVRLADQPPDASLLAPDAPDKGIARSAPAWSPDGAMLAWTELTLPEMQNRLAIHDFARGVARVIDLGLPEQYGVPTPLEAQWGGGGIAIRSFTYDPAAERVRESILVYDAEGDLRAETDLGATEDEFSIEYIWVADSGQDYVGVLYNTGRWALIDPATGDLRPTGDAPALYSRRQGPGGVSVTFTMNPDRDYEWSVIYPDGRREPLGVFNLWQIALSPSGEQIFLLDYPDYGRMSLWRGGQLTPLEAPSPESNVLAAAWGPMAWRTLRGGDASEPATAQPAVTCPGFLPSRLAAGGEARVLPGSPNNIRRQPTTGSLRVGQIPAGGVFTVLSGPECADETAWWQVDYQGAVGWTAEGQGDTYWVEPLP